MRRVDYVYTVGQNLYRHISVAFRRCVSAGQLRVALTDAVFVAGLGHETHAGATLQLAPGGIEEDAVDYWPAGLERFACLLHNTAFSTRDCLQDFPGHVPGLRKVGHIND